MGEFSHFDQAGNAMMVDVSEKQVTVRTAAATGTIKVNQEIMEAIQNRQVKKGDVLGVARVAGIMAAKRTWELIPMCHPLAIRKCTVDFETDPEKQEIRVIARVKVEEKTGVEMEALTAASVSLLTIYDMCKSIDRRMEITGVHLLEKTGGKSGDFSYD
ncbi:MAG: cyclic pyranopterin monophosphate synthase MoaC [Candidatus Choladocola sp.]|nr:cyclic pyranopterin monophosphate synthase MoaC [Candidatus Choladocola sp.]